jgi:hypothetical protein
MTRGSKPQLCYAKPTCDFDTDAADRLMQLLAAAPQGHLLKRAASMAGEQLELMKPGVLFAGPKGVVGEIVANVEIGTFLIVLADDKRVATIGNMPLSGHAILQNVSRNL